MKDTEQSQSGNAMTEDEKDYGERVTFILGMVTHLLMDMRPKMNPTQKKGFAWFSKAVDEVVYKGNGLPPLEKE